MTVRGSIVSFQSTGFRLLRSGHSDVPKSLSGLATCIPSSSKRGDPEYSLMPVAYFPSYETLMTPPGAFVCWTDLVASPATRTTLRSPVPPSRFSMRQESCRPFKENAKRLGTWPLSTLRSSPTEQRPENVVSGSPTSRITTSGLPPGSSPRVISGGGDTPVVSSPVVGADVVSCVTSVFSLGGLFLLSGFLVSSEQAPTKSSTARSSIAAGTIARTLSISKDPTSIHSI